MNHRSTYIPENRNHAGQRHRAGSEPFGSNQSRHSAPSAEGRYAAPATAAGYGAQSDDRFDWAANDQWAQQDSWSNGSAWSADEAWASDSDNSWTPESQSSWPPDTQSAWTPDSRSSWSPDAQASRTTDPRSSWTPDADDSWDGDDSWTPESDDDSAATPTVIPPRRAHRKGGAHRVPAPPAALKGRAAVAAVAAGAFVAAGQAAMASPELPAQTIDYEAAGQIHEIAAQSVSMADTDASPASPQVLNVAAPSTLGEFGDMLQKGQKFAEDLAAEEEAKLRPLFSKFFAAGNFTSGYGARWGVQHLGVDIAGPIGTPIYAVADATVIEAGPAAGFGMWVRLLHDDGTVTIYGHIDTSTVSAGERVLAGDQIATMGNRGFSTGPHCHFEVWLNGVDKVDPLPWLATRGISLGSRRD